MLLSQSANFFASPLFYKKGFETYDELELYNFK